MASMQGKIFGGILKVYKWLSDFFAALYETYVNVGLT